MIIIPNVDKENSCLDCPVWSLCWDNKPTEDICKDRCPIVEPKHGRWIEHHEPFSWMGYTTWTCSECNYEVGYEKDIKNTTNYCPNCGATMDGGEK